MTTVQQKIVELNKIYSSDVNEIRLENERLKYANLLAYSALMELARGNNEINPDEETKHILAIEEGECDHDVLNAMLYPIEDHYTEDEFEEDLARGSFF